MASLTLTLTHPSLTRSVTITVPDARMLEFVDALRSYVYGTQTAPVTRIQAAETLLNDLAANARAMYARAKQAEADAAVIPIGEIDA
jgi:hypothetical protein